MPENAKKLGVKKPLLQVGGGGWIRTTEAKRNRFTVCPLWPLGNSSVFSWCPNQIEAQRSGSDLERCGAGGRIRTPDLLITNQLLYRLSYTSTWRRSNSERYYSKEKKGCQVENQKIFAPPLRDIQTERPVWICVRCGGEQYHFDRGEWRYGRHLCTRCMEDLRVEEEMQ